MRLLVTGGAGFIGANFIHYWRKAHPGDHLTNLDKLTYAGNLENLKALEGDSNHQFVKGDISDAQTVDQVTNHIDLIVHFAAESHVDRSIEDPDAFIQTNINGTFTLLEAARRKDIRFHHISTDEVFGSLELNSSDKFTEKSCYHPSSPYSASKAASDHLVNSYHHTYGLKSTTSNCSNNFGPYQFPEKFIALAITNLIEGKPVPIYGDGRQTRDWLYVEDHCRAIDQIITHGKIGATYLVGGLSRGVSNLEVVKLIINIMGAQESSIEFVKDRPGHDRRYDVDWSKINNELGFKPAFEFEQYLAKTVQWYQNNQSWWRRIKTGQYQEYYRRQYQDR